MPPELLCAACAEYELRRVTAAGRRTAGVAAMVTLATSTIAALLFIVFTGGPGRYSGSKDPLVKSETPYLVLAFATIAIVAVGVSLVFGSFAARSLARRRVREERELPSAEREAIERRFRERADRSRG